MTATIGDLNATSFKYKWAINDYSQNTKKTSEWMESPKFNVSGPNGSSEWYIRLYPRGNNEPNKDYVSVFLYNASNTDIVAISSFRIIKSENAEVNHTQAEPEKFERNKGLGYPRFILREELLDPTRKYLHGDTLIMTCKVIVPKYATTTKKSELSSTMDKLTKERENLCAGLEKLVDTPDYSDVTFTVEGKPIRGHKCILASRSPVFADMFRKLSDDQTDTKPTTINIDDAKYDVFAKLLHYVYSGKVNDIKDKAAELIPIAEKYKLDGLVKLGETALIENMGIDNVWLNQELAQRYNLRNLKVKTIKFIASHVDQLLKNV